MFSQRVIDVCNRFVDGSRSCLASELLMYGMIEVTVNEIWAAVVYLVERRHIIRKRPLSSPHAGVLDFGEMYLSPIVINQPAL